MTAVTRRAERTSADAILIGASEAMRHVRRLIARYAPATAPVLVTGPSGSGKEMVARALHAASPRAGRAFVAVNCGAIPAELIESELFGHERGSFTGATTRRIGRFEEADGGTLFLDEIGEMPAAMQVKLLRVLEDGVVHRVGGTGAVVVDVRIVCATHRDLPAAIEEGRFREDLFYRIGVLPVVLPALTERTDDIGPLIEHFQERLGAEHRVDFGRDAMARLARHRWPGNVRELRNVLERARVLFAGERIDADAAAQLLGRAPPTNVTYIRDARPEAVLAAPPTPAGAPINLKELIETLEQEQIQHALDAADGVVSEAARLLTLKRTTLTEKMRKYRVG